LQPVKERTGASRLLCIRAWSEGSWTHGKEASRAYQLPASNGVDAVAEAHRRLPAGIVCFSAVFPSTLNSYRHMESSRVDNEASPAAPAKNEKIGPMAVQYEYLEGSCERRCADGALSALSAEAQTTHSCTVPTIDASPCLQQHHVPPLAVAQINWNPASEAPA
jgi:hypothetical protein